MTEQGPKKSLEVVYSACENLQEIKVDIIAIHGLNTNPDRSFIAYQTEGDQNSRKVHWLRDRDMLPAKLNELDPKVPARIFTYTWNSATFDKASDNYFHQHAETLLRCIADMHHDTKTKDIPIIFIASCFGGLILVKALLLARSSYQYIVDQTSGIVFMGTPFRGSPGQSPGEVRVIVARHIFGAEASPSLLKVLDQDPGSLQELTDNFVALAEKKGIDMFVFYEKGKTNIIKDILPRSVLGTVRMESITELVLVPKDSACLDGSAVKIGLPVKHALLNKFRGPSDHNFLQVSERIKDLVSKAVLAHKHRARDEAYMSICNNHYTLKCLEIKRLSGARLDMNQCYINLIITEKSNEYSNDEHLGQRSSPFSLLNRLSVAHFEKENDIVLSTLFDPREMRDNQKRHPSRVLIQGQAGVGKTTLCKKIVHDFIYCNMWGNLFDLLLWVPLRRLKVGFDNEHNLGGLLCHLYFKLHRDGHRLAKSLWDAIDAPDSRALFILDGLDEVSELLDPDHKASIFLKDLLNRHNVIITTRSHTGWKPYLKEFDLKLETIGFFPKQVDHYIENVVANRQSIIGIQSFLQAHPLVQSLVRIPIQLDAFCYTWDGGDSDVKLPADSSSETMTSVYRSIEIKLLKKDAVKLEKTTNQRIKLAHPKQVTKFVEREKALLENLAFSGIYGETLEFDLDAIAEFYKPIANEPSTDETLSQLSFLRTSDPSAENRTYHFIHLTFQEYFAAQYFVRQWKERKPLKCLEFRSGQMNEIDPLEFVKRHKYNPRYNLVWRFIAGLLDAEGEDGKLQFFHAIEEEPRDLLGPTHQRLIMYCLSEVSSNDVSAFSPMKDRLEHQLLQWLHFEIRFTRRSRLVCEEEFPIQVLCKALQSASSAEKVQLFKGISIRRTIPLAIIQKAASWLRGDISRDLQRAILELIQNSNQGLWYDTLMSMVALLEHADSQVRSAAVDALRRQSALPEGILTAIVAKLDHDDMYVRSAAVSALECQSALPEGILTAVVSRLDHTNSHVRSAAAEALRLQSALPEGILIAIEGSLKHADIDVRLAAISALERQSALPEGILTAVVSMLDHTNSHVRWKAAETLGRQSALPEAIVIAIEGRLEHANIGVRSAAVSALRHQSALPEGILTAVVSMLDHADSNVRSTVAEALARQSALPERILIAIEGRLEHADIDVRLAAVSALGRQSALPEAILTAMVARLEHADSHVRWTAAAVLGSQSALPEAILTAMVARLDHADSHVRSAAVSALGSQSAPPEAILTAMLARLDDADMDVRWKAVKVLRRQSALPDGTLTAMVARLEHADMDVRWAAVSALRRQLTLPEGILTAMVTRLDDTDMDVRSEAVAVLERQSALPEAILTAMVARLDDTDSHVRSAAVDVLGNQSALPEAILTAMVARLDHADSHVRSAAVSALGRESALPDGTLTAMVARLDHADSHVRWVAVSALGRESALPDGTLTAMVAKLDHADSHIRWAAAEALRRQSALPEEILIAIEGRLEHADVDVRSAAVSALGRQSALPEAILTEMVARLDDAEIDVQWDAVDALERQPVLSEGILTAIVARLDDADMDFRWKVVDVLGRQSALPEGILTAMLENSDINVRWAAIKVLRRQSALPDMIFEQQTQLLYKAFLEASFTEDMPWYNLNGTLYIAMENGEIGFDGSQGWRKDDVIQKIQQNLGVPSKEPISF